MAISEKFGDLVTEKSQRDKVIRARAILQEARGQIEMTCSQLQAIADSGSFNTVGAEIKSVLLTGLGVLKTAQTGFAEPNVAALLDWSK